MRPHAAGPAGTFHHPRADDAIFLEVELSGTNYYFEKFAIQRTFFYCRYQPKAGAYLQVQATTLSSRRELFTLEGLLCWTALLT